MNLKTFAEEQGIELSEAKELTGLTHWNKQVPEEFLAKEKELCPVSLEILDVSLRGAGNKSPYYQWKHLLDG